MLLFSDDRPFLSDCVQNKWQSYFATRLGYETVMTLTIDSTTVMIQIPKCTCSMENFKKEDKKILAIIFYEIKYDKGKRKERA